MTAERLARVATVLTVLVGGGVLGHLVLPVRGGVVRWDRALAFALAMLALGAFRGWRESVVREVAVPRRRRWSAGFGAAALVLAVVGYLLVHGRPR